MVDDAEQSLLADGKARDEFLRIFPNGDYEKTIMRTCDFWRSDRGYEYKLKGKSKEINMISTIKNNWDKNVIYVTEQSDEVLGPKTVVRGGIEWQL